MSAFLESASVSVANGSNTVTVTGSVNCGQVVSGTAVIIDGILVEGASGTAPNGGGTSTITLAKPWDFPTKSAVRMIVFNTFEGMVGVVARAREASASSTNVLSAFNEVLTATTPTISVNINGVATTVTPYGYLAAQSEALIAELEAASGALAGLEQDIATLTQDVAAQQGIVNTNLTASNNAATLAQDWASKAEDSIVASGKYSAFHYMNKSEDFSLASAGSASAASGSASAANGSAINAATSATLAQDWAAKPEDSIVTGGLYSALHYSAKSQGFSVAAGGSATAAAGSATLAEDWANKPENSVVANSKYSALHYAAKAEFWAGQAAGAAAGALVYVGQYNASGNAFPTSPTSGYVYEISAQGTLTGFENIAGSQTVRPGDHIAKTSTGWVLWFGYQTTLPTARGGTGRTDGKVTELATSRNFSITGKATASAVGFTGAGNVALNVTSITATIAEVTNLQTTLDTMTAATARARLFGLIGMIR